MKKFRIQPESSVVRLQRAIKTGLGSDLVVIGELLGFITNQSCRRGEHLGISPSDDKKSEPWRQ